MTVDVRFTKGGYSVGIETNSVSEEYTNKLIPLILAQSSTNQASGKKDTKIIDLLRITHQFVIKGYITNIADATSATNDTSGGSTSLTAKQIKDNLKTLATGAKTDGGEITMSYDGDDLEGYIEKIVVTNEAKDYPSSPSVDVLKYELAITFVVGVSK